MERLHGTMEREMDAEDVADVRDHFEHHRRLYNEVRPHDALGMATPSSHYAPSPRRLDDDRTKDPSERWDTTRSVYPSGEIHWRGTLVFVSEAFVGHRVGLRQQTMTTWSVHFHDLVVGTIDDDGCHPARR